VYEHVQARRSDGTLFEGLDEERRQVLLELMEEDRPTQAHILAYIGALQLYPSNIQN
jgi:hypothetical protein